MVLVHHIAELVVEGLKLARSLPGQRVDAQSVILASRPGDVDLAEVRPQDQVVESLLNAIEVEVRDRADDVFRQPVPLA